MLFIVQLLLSWVTISAAMGSTVEGNSSDPFARGSLKQVVFFASVVFSLLVAIEGIINPRARWRQLRHSAGSLHSIMWHYRTRVAAFEVDNTRRDSRKPEAALFKYLSEWRTGLASVANLKNSNLLRTYPLHVYCHFQLKREEHEEKLLNKKLQARTRRAQDTHLGAKIMSSFARSWWRKREQTEMKETAGEQITVDDFYKPVKVRASFSCILASCLVTHLSHRLGQISHTSPCSWHCASAATSVHCAASQANDGVLPLAHSHV